VIWIFIRDENNLLNGVLTTNQHLVIVLGQYGSNAAVLQAKLFCVIVGKEVLKQKMKKKMGKEER
jgi:hypothetical protein